MTAERGSKPYVVVVAVTEYERVLKGREQRGDWKGLVNQARDQIQAERFSLSAAYD